MLRIKKILTVLYSKIRLIIFFILLAFYQVTIFIYWNLIKFNIIAAGEKNPQLAISVNVNGVNNALDVAKDNNTK